jgi:hypothetical protein
MLPTEIQSINNTLIYQIKAADYEDTYHYVTSENMLKALSYMNQYSLNYDPETGVQSVHFILEGLVGIYDFNKDDNYWDLRVN